MVTHERKVVVTGCEAMTPLDLTMEGSWEKLLKGESGVDYIKSFNPDDFGLEVKIAGEVRGFDPDDWIGRDARRMDRFSQLGVAAAAGAVKSAGLEITDDIKDKVAVIMATGVGGLSTTIKQTVRLYKDGKPAEPLSIPMLMPNAVTGNVSMWLGCKGMGFTPVSACSSSADAIGLGLILIRSGRAKVVIAGGSESAVNPLGISGFESLKALTRFKGPPHLASCPFSRRRSGFVMADGVAVVVLEEEEFANARGARPLAVLAGYGATMDAYHITKPDEDGSGGVEATRLALQDAKVIPEDVSYINAHGTSTPINDAVETRVIHAAYGDSAFRIPVSSTKSMTGHLLGAGGALEAVVCVKVIQTGWAPPTINLDDPDPECNLCHIVDKAQEIQCGPKGRLVAVSNSFAFGGHNSVLVFTSVD